MIGEDRQWKVKMKFNRSALPSGKHFPSTVNVDEFEDGVKKYSPLVTGNQGKTVNSCCVPKAGFETFGKFVHMFITIP
jgi:hypothetical protein